jgi:hypothetical protein
MNQKDIKTIADLQQYLYEQPSSIVADLINGALQFFMAECKFPNGNMDWKAVKERRNMKMRYRLEDHHNLTADICKALLNWMLSYGRDIGTDLLDAKLSHAQGVEHPRKQAFDLLYALVESSA